MKKCVETCIGTDYTFLLSQNILADLKGPKDHFLVLYVSYFCTKIGCGFSPRQFLLEPTNYVLEQK